MAYIYQGLRSTVLDDIDNLKNYTKWYNRAMLKFTSNTTMNIVKECGFDGTWTFEEF